MPMRYQHLGTCSRPGSPNPIPLGCAYLLKVPGALPLISEGAHGWCRRQCLGRLSRPRASTYNLHMRFPAYAGSRHRAQPLRFPLHFEQPRSCATTLAPSCCCTPDGSHGPLLDEVAQTVEVKLVPRSRLPQCQVCDLRQPPPSPSPVNDSLPSPLSTQELSWVFCTWAVPTASLEQGRL